MKLKKIAALIAAALFSAVTLLGGCSYRDMAEITDKSSDESQTDEPEENSQEMTEDDEISDEIQETESSENIQENDVVFQNTADEEEEGEQTATYIMVTASGVNIRSGAGTSYSSYGTAEQNTLYAFYGEVNGWYKTYYKSKAAYISSKYCKIVELASSENSLIEAVISEGCKLLGVTYVYGAVRLHDGNGNLYKGFTATEFDCSSLMQYIFYYGCGYLLNVNTRTQIYQGTTVTKSQLQRGDLMFFTNASRCNNSGIERVGHVGIYLGDNYILHTSSDYAKIEQINSTRWSYFIQGQRLL